MEQVCKGCNSRLFNNGECLYCGRQVATSTLIDGEISGQLSLAREAIEQDYDFQRAFELSHGILEKHPDSQEANWVALLSENQIIYIQNGSGDYVPTFLDAEERSLTDSKYYKALDKERKEKADVIEKKRLETVAEMNKVKGQPYDVFISYKQHHGEDGNGTLTEEADVAQQLYNQFIKDDRTRHMNIFFDKESLGKNNAGWEPHIYSAIKTAKMMVVVASSIENINARWVKNEWMRFLKYRARGDKKEIIVLGTTKNDVDPKLFPKMIAETKSQALYLLDDWRENICTRAAQACLALQNDKLGTVEFVDKRTSKKIVAKRDNIALTDLSSFSSGNTQTTLTFETRFKMIKDDISSSQASIRQGALKDLQKLKQEFTQNGAVDGRILALELVANCGLYSIEDFNRPENIDRISDLSIFKDIFNNGGTAEWKYSVLEILYNYLLSSRDTRNQLQILDIVIDFKYKRREELLTRLLENAIQDVCPEIFEVVLPRLELSSEQEVVQIIKFASEAFGSNNFNLAVEYAQKVLSEYDEGNVDAKDILLLANNKVKTYGQFFGSSRIGTFTDFDALQDILSYMPEDARISKLNYWNDCIVDACRSSFPQNFTVFYDRFLMFYPTAQQNKKLQKIADMALNNQSYDIALHYYNYRLQHAKNKEEIYWQMMLCDLRCRKESELYKLTIDISENKYFDKALSSAANNEEFTAHILQVRKKQREESDKNRAAQARRDALNKSNDIWYQILSDCGCRNDTALNELAYSVYEHHTKNFDEAIYWAEQSEDSAQIKRLTSIKRDQARAAAINARRKKTKGIKLAFVLTIQALCLITVASIILSAVAISPFMEFWTVWSYKLFSGVGGQYALIGVIGLLMLILLIVSATRFHAARNMVCAALVFLLVSSSVVSAFVLEGKAKAGESNVFLGENYIVYYRQDKETDGYVAYKVSSTRDGAEVVIPSTYNGKKVTGIGKKFAKNAHGIDLVLPATVREITADMFSGQTGIKSIQIPSSVRRIEEGSFEGCTSLEEIVVPFLGTEIYDSEHSYLGYIFGANSSRDNAEYVPETLKSVTVLSSNIMTESIRGEEYTAHMMAERAFSGCTGLENVVLPDDLEFISINSFNGCSSLKSVSVGENLKSIETGAFEGCKALEKVNITSVSSWCNIQFANETANPLYYAHNLYTGDELITELTVPDSVRQINEYAFINAKCLQKVSISGQVERIGFAAFAGCSGITEITVPFVGNYNGVGYEGGLFGYIFGTMQYDGGIKVEQHSSRYNTVIFYLPASLTKVTVLGGYVGYGAFSNCVNLTTVILGEDVTGVHSTAFDGCENLTEPGLQDEPETQD